MPHPTEQERRERQEQIERYRSAPPPPFGTIRRGLLSRRDIQPQAQRDDPFAGFIPTPLPHAFPPDPYSRQSGRFDPRLHGGFEPTDYAFPTVPSFEPQVYPLSYGTVAPGESFWNLEDWRDRVRDIIPGAIAPFASLFGVGGAVRGLRGDEEGGRLERAVSAVEELHPDAPLWLKPLAAMGGAVEEELRAIEAVEETTAPVRGYLTSRPWDTPLLPFGTWPIEDEFVRQRVQINLDRGMDHVSAWADAYNRAEAAPEEMSGWKEAAMRGVTSPLEALPVVGAYGFLTSLAARGLGRGLGALGRRGATEAVRGVTQPVTQMAARTPLTSLTEQAAMRATTMERGKLALVESLRLKHGSTVEAVNNMEVKISDALKRLEMPPTRTPQDQVIRNEVKWFLETANDQLAAAKATERSALIALRGAQAKARGKTARVALTQRDLAIGRQLPTDPTRPGAAPAARAADVTPTGPATRVDLEGMPRSTGRIEPGVRAAPIEDVTGVALTKAKPGVRGAIRRALERLGIGQSPVPPKSGRELAKIEAMWDEGGKPASRDFPDAYLQIQEYANDTYFGLRRLQTQVGKRIPIVAGGQYDLITQLTLGPGAANAGATRYALAIEEIKRIGPIQVNDVNTIIFANHGESILAKKGAGRVLPGGLKSAEELDAGIAQLRAKLSKEQFAQAEEGARVIQRIYQEERVRMAQAGLITNELAVDLAKRYPWYNPLKYVAYIDAQWRVGKSIKPFTVLSSGFRRLTEEGTEEAIRGPLEVLGEQLIQNEVRIQKNETAKAIIKLALEDPSLGVKKVSAVKPVAQVEGKPVFRPVGGDLPGTLSFFENGKRQIYKVPDFIDREAIMLNQSMRNPAASLIGSLNGISRAAFTSVSPPFVVANMLNDMLVVFAMRGILPHQTVKKLTESLRGLTKDPAGQKFRLAGGYQMRFFGRSGEQIAREVGASGGQIVGTGPSFLRQLKSAIPKAGEQGEQATRMAVFNKALDKTLPNWRSMTPEAVAATPQARVAAASAVESTINFARGGHLIKSLNPWIIFLNATMEGTKLPFRALRENAGFRWRMAGLGVGQAGLTAYNMSYPEYFDVPIRIRHGSGLVMLSSKEKDIYGNPKPRYLTFIPTTRELALWFGSIVFAMEKMFSDNPTEFGEFARSLAPQVSPLNEIPSPIALAEAFEQAFNYDLFRSRKIVPTEMQTMLPEEQVMPWTSRTIQEVANTVGISPIRLQHGFSGILGGAGRTFTSVTDYILNSLMPREVSPETKALVERYEAFETPTERRSMVQELSSDQRKAMFNELRQPDPSIPVVSPIVGRVLRDRGGQLRLTREEQAAKLTGISPEQTREAGSLLQKVSDARIDMQRQIDRQLRDDTLPPDQRINPKEWRLERHNFSEQYKGVLLTLGVQFPGAAQIHKDQSVKTKYYKAITIAADSMVDPRMRGQAIAAGWYAITAKGPEGTIGLEDVGAMFDERDQYREGLSLEDRSLLDAELESRMTPVEREYSRDMEVIRQSRYWDITDTLIDSQGIRDLWERYYEEPVEDRKVFLRNLMDKNPEQHAKFTATQRARDDERHFRRSTDCDLERNFLKWGYISVPKCKDVIRELQADQIKKLREGGFNLDPVGVMNNGSSTGSTLP